MALRNKEVEREYTVRGLDAPAALGDASRLTVADAAARFIKNQGTLGKAPATVYGYTRAVEQFRDSCRKTYLDPIERQDMFDHIEWIRENVPTRAHGQQNGTVRTRLPFLTVFFTENGNEKSSPDERMAEG